MNLTLGNILITVLTWLSMAFMDLSMMCLEGVQKIHAYQEKA